MVSTCSPECFATRLSSSPPDPLAPPGAEPLRRALSLQPQESRPCPTPTPLFVSAPTPHCFAPSALRIPPRIAPSSASAVFVPCSPYRASPSGQAAASPTSCNFASTPPANSAGVARPASFAAASAFKAPPTATSACSPSGSTGATACSPPKRSSTAPAMRRRSTPGEALPRAMEPNAWRLILAHHHLDGSPVAHRRRLAHHRAPRAHARVGRTPGPRPPHRRRRSRALRASDAPPRVSPRAARRLPLATRERILARRTTSALHH